MKFNTTIDNVSPLISYTPVAAWAPESHTDTFWTEYSEGTYSVSTTLGAAATFTFNGTGIWIMGALRDNHGQYNVSLDGTNSTFDGVSTTNKFQQPLFSATDLQPGLHVVSLINNRQNSKLTNLDLDFIIWENELGSDTDVVTSKTEQDTEASFQYGPAATSWSTAVENSGDYSGNSGHSTISTTGFVTYTFTGSAVSIFGTLGPSQGPYQVQLDGGAAQNFTATNTAFHAQSLLYRADNLDNSQHTVVLTNAPKTPGQSLAIDYAVITDVQAAVTSSQSSTQSSSTSTNTEPTSIDPPPPLSNDTKKTPAGVVAGVIIGILVLLGLVAFILLRVSRRRKRKQYKEEPDMLVVPEPYGFEGHGNIRYIPPSLAMNGDFSLSTPTGPAPLYPPSRPSQTDMYNVVRNGSTASLFSGVAPAVAPGPGSNRYPHGSAVADTSVYARDSAYTASSEVIGPLNQPLPALPDPSNETPQAPPFSLIPPRKASGITLPPTASEEERREFEGLSEEELRRRRINVRGRAQDFGPVIMNPDDDQLPPDYSQATEKLQR